MNIKTERWSTGRRLVGSMGTILAVALVITGCSSTSAGSSTGNSKLTIGEIFPFTGAKSQLSDWGVHGVNTGVYEVNHNGGVLGHQLQIKSADDAADSVDTLPAFRKLLLSNPRAIVGPFSPTIEAVINNFGPSHVVDFMVGGATQLDKMNYPYVFRTNSSDSTESVAMAYYAAKVKGFKSASLIFDNSANSQGFITPLTAAFKKLGGTIQQNLSIVPGQGSYRSELTKAFADKPDVIFASFDTQTAATLWANARQLGYLNTPWVGDDLESSNVYAKAFGPTASTKLFSAVPAAPTGNSYAHFLADYKAVYKDAQPLPTTYNSYDSIVIAALAMTKANSIDPKVWSNDVVSVASPPGTACSDYSSCVALLKTGKDINFEGAGGDDDFNKYHNVFSGFTVVGFNSDLTNTAGTYVTGAQIAKSVG